MEIWIYILVLQGCRPARLSSEFNSLVVCSCDAWPAGLLINHRTTLLKNNMINIDKKLMCFIEFYYIFVFLDLPGDKF